MLAAVPPLAAHMVSISTGEIRIEGDQGRYELRMPVYEIQHMSNPEAALIGAVKFSSGGVDAARTGGKCRQDSAENALICEITYRFAGPVDVIEAQSTLHSVTVPNHVHVLRAVNGGKTDQGVLDLSFPRAELRFRPPTLAERAVRQSMAGALRAAGGAAQWLFLLALVLASRSRREAMLLAATFLAAEIASTLILPVTGWTPAPRFVEAACALTIAYLAVEILLLPQAGMRWLVVAVLGIFHGWYFSLFITGSDFSAAWVLLGVVLTEIALLAGLGWALTRLNAPLRSLQPVRISAAILLVVGLGWFFLRLRG
jgi:hypothetical protein